MIRSQLMTSTADQNYDFNSCHWSKCHSCLSRWHGHSHLWQRRPEITKSQGSSGCWRCWGLCIITVWILNKLVIFNVLGILEIVLFQNNSVNMDQKAMSNPSNTTKILNTNLSNPSLAHIQNPACVGFQVNQVSCWSAASQIHCWCSWNFAETKKHSKQTTTCWSVPNRRSIESQKHPKS